MGKVKVVIIFIVGLIVGLYIQRLIYINRIYTQEQTRLKTELQNMEDPTRIYTLVTKLVSPSIVGITGELEVRRTWLDFDIFEELFAPRSQKQTFQVKGSGIVYDSNHIITNYHVIEPVLQRDGFGRAICDINSASQTGNILVHLYKEKAVKATVIGCDPENDVAVLKVDGVKLSEPQFGDSDKIEVAQGVLVLGNPFGLGISVSSGIIGAKERRLVFSENENFRAPLIQINASINKGNSGGAVVNLKGEIIGLVTAAVLSRDASATSGIGFAVPINVVKKVVKKILSKSGKPFIGIEYIEINEESLGFFATEYNEKYITIQELLSDLGLEKEGGVFIKRIMGNSPADRAGLKEGDVILKIDNIEISDASKLRDIILNYSPGDKVTLEIVRNKKKKNIDVILGRK